MNAKFRVWKHPHKNFWLVSYGPYQLFTAPFLSWEEAIFFAQARAEGGEWPSSPPPDFDRRAALLGYKER